MNAATPLGVWGRFVMSLAIKLAQVSSEQMDADRVLQIKGAQGRVVQGQGGTRHSPVRIRGSCHQHRRCASAWRKGTEGRAAGSMHGVAQLACICWRVLILPNVLPNDAVLVLQVREDA